LLSGPPTTLEWDNAVGMVVDSGKHIPDPAAAISQCGKATGVHCQFALLTDRLSEFKGDEWVGHCILFVDG
jgi:hypothetical protein